MKSDFNKNIGNYSEISFSSKVKAFLILSAYYVFMIFSFDYIPTKENHFNMPYNCNYNNLPEQLKAISIVLFTVTYSSLFFVFSILLILLVTNRNK